MKRTLITPELEIYPHELRRLIEGADVYDSSCSPEARVIFIDRDGGYFLKTAKYGALKTEAEMTAYFHGLGLGAKVLYYGSEGQTDFFMTERVAGEDCVHKLYVDDPARLCDLIATKLRALHEIVPKDCPVTDRMSGYLALAEKNHSDGICDLSLFSGDFGFSSAEEAWSEVEKNGKYLKNEVLLHGDYCLPNIILDDWRFSGFIDVGNGGIGDRHVDIFWGIWTLFFNLKTEKYTQRFLDAYGRDKVISEKLRTVAAAEVFG